MRKRICEGVDAASAGIPEQMVSLVNFLGPLPEGLVAQHPNREELFTPEGYVLRPTTPGAGEQALEALEPSVPAVPARTGSDCIPRPHLVAEALSGVDGANDILEFLGRLLHPDPEQRPSATEAMAHHFLRFAHTKGGANEEMKHTHFEEGTVAESEAKPVDGGVKMPRKGTGFVHVGELPPSDDEDEDEDDEEEEQQRGSKQQGGKHVHIEAKEEPKEDKKGAAPMSRKGTGFVHVGELPPSDDEDEDEDEEEAKPAAKHVTVEAGGPEKGEKKDGSPLARKGTGFVHMGELPPSDSEEEEEEEEEDETPKAPKVLAGGARQVVVEDTGSRGSAKTKEGGNMARKGTGFVHMGELPGSDDEDEDEEEEEAPEKAKHVHLSAEAELAAKREAEKVPPGDGKMARKGTSFVQMGELPPSDDEDEEEEEEEEEPAKPVKKEVHISEKDKVAAGHGQGDDDGQGGGRMSRKGTGFVHMGELPPSDSEDEEEDEERPRAASSKKVKIAADEVEAKPEGESKMARKGTGFVNHGDLPDDSDDEGEEDEEEEKAPVKKGVDFDTSAQQEENKKTSARPARKGTGFVNVADIPDSDDEDEDEAPAISSKKTVGFDAEPEQEKAKPDTDGVVGKVARKGTGFVHMSEIVDSDDDEEDEALSSLGAVRRLIELRQTDLVTWNFQVNVQKRRA
eukprot:CAMPEP_0183514374 /NCGR_PEP_ID=MMETSP0371-20130417/12835_1 /TAXON_ID=268820 /ORGANISM="Peridinium aciculiferum, Strain PAER-2" /LENGTH=682 /DNA_ID=CAMNT_0025711763 /DNA_START=32 /DNA_END=2078 /DNA_ORIENTATION=-